MRTIIPVLLLVTSLGGGCARQVCTESCCTPIQITPVPEVNTARGNIIADVAAAASLEKVSADIPPLPPAQAHRLLSAQQVQCLSAANASDAALVDMEQKLSCHAGEQCSLAREAIQLQADILALRANDIRNEAAATALALYFRLAEAESSRDALAMSRRVVDTAVNESEKLRGQGLRIDADPQDFRRRQLEITNTQITLAGQIEELNGKLKLLLGLSPVDPTPIWPAADLTVLHEPLDLDAAIGMALQNRYDYRTLQITRARLTAKTLPVARAVLSQQEGAVGSHATRTGILQIILHPVQRQRDCELKTRQSQLERLLYDAERLITEEVRAAAVAVETSLRNIAAAAEIEESRQLSLDRALHLRKLGEVKPADVIAARLELVQAQSKLLSAVVQWKLAQVTLKKVQGLLAAECGHFPKTCCEYGCTQGCCDSAGHCEASCAGVAETSSFREQVVASESIESAPKSKQTAPQAESLPRKDSVPAGPPPVVIEISPQPGEVEPAPSTDPQPTENLPDEAETPDELPLPPFQPLPIPDRFPPPPM